MPRPEPRPDPRPASLPADYSDVHPLRLSLALVVLVLVLAAAHACYTLVRDVQRSYLGEGLKR